MCVSANVSLSSLKPTKRDSVASDLRDPVSLQRSTTGAAAIPHVDFTTAASLIAETGRELAALGWTPATSSNFSIRCAPDRVAITISGRDKGRLGPGDVMKVDLDGRARDAGLRPSAETLLHVQLYRRWPEVGAVLHTHSRVQTVASRLYARDGEIRLADYELLKAFAGESTHQTELRVPVYPNTQDMAALAATVDASLDADPRIRGYLIEGHGIYTWGRDLAETRRHLEAFEFLLACELDLRRLA